MEARANRRRCLTSIKVRIVSGWRATNSLLKSRHYIKDMAVNELELRQRQADAGVGVVRRSDTVGVYTIY